jgi:precorrin-2 dehydrogenase
VRVEGLACLVVGGGRVAARKATSLLECGAHVTVVAPLVCAEIERLPVTILRREYEPREATHYRLVVTATGVAEVDRAVFEDGENAGLMVNAADNPESCRFFLPSLFRRGPVTVAVSTAGTSPFLAVWLRRRIGEVVGPEFAEAASLLARARRALKEAGQSTEAADWDSLLDEDLVAALATGRGAAAKGLVDEWLTSQLRGHGGPGTTQSC